MKAISHECIIIGGGLIGLTLGLALARQGISTAIVEKKPFADYRASKSDGRASAIAAGSRVIFEKYGIWQHIIPFTGPINDIRITDGNCPLFLHFDHQQVGDKPLGHMVENHDLLQVLLSQAENQEHLSLYSGRTVTRHSRDAIQVEAELDNGECLTGRLLIAADGKFSPLRQAAAIDTLNWEYNQAAIVCTVAHEKHHHGIAQERFLPSGPFAILPLKGGHQSSLVWTEKKHLAPVFAQMEEAEFLAHLTGRFGEYLGNLRVASPIFTYPLSVCYAKEYHAERLVLVGDSAHAIHPIAGQGFNLGLRDVDALVEVLGKYHQLGIDSGSALVREAYSRSRRVDNLAMLAITDSLNHLFVSNIAPVVHLRRLGLGAVNQLPRLQEFFMRYAMGER